MPPVARVDLYLGPGRERRNMKIIDVEQNSDEWLELRKRRIGGTRLGDVWSARAYLKKDLIKLFEEQKIEFKKSASTSELEQLLTDDMRLKLLKDVPRKQGFYELIAEHLGIDRDNEDRMERGHRLEIVARQWFEETYKKKVEQVGICMSDVDDRIYNSPDGLIRKSPNSKKWSEAVEIKCLSPARHIQAVIENQVPEEYWSQQMQYFVVNEDLETLYFVFHDPSIPAVPYHVIEVHRKDLEDWPRRLLEFQIAQLQRIDEIIAELAF